MIIAIILGEPTLSGPIALEAQVIIEYNGRSGKRRGAYLPASMEAPVNIRLLGRFCSICNVVWCLDMDVSGLGVKSCICRVLC